MKKAVIITSIITVLALLCTIGFTVGVAVSGVTLVANSNLSTIPDSVMSILDIVEEFVPALEIEDELRAEIREEIENYDGNMGEVISGLFNEAFDESKYTNTILQKEYNASEISAIKLNLDLGSVKLVKADGDKAVVTVKSRGNFNFSDTDATLFNRTLSVKISGGPSMFTKDDFEIANGVLAIIALPEGAYSQLKADIDAGGIFIDGISARVIELDIDAGNAEIRNTKGDVLIADVDAGNIVVGENNRFEQSIDIKADCGNVTLSLPADLGYFLNYKINMGSFTAEQPIGTDSSLQGNYTNLGGGAQVDVKVDLGNVTLKQG